MYKKMRNRTSTLGLLYPVRSFQNYGLALQYLDVGYLELLILVQGNARARMWDKRGSRAPTSFRFIMLNRRIRGAIGNEENGL
jgi:hypothetical protein